MTTKAAKTCPRISVTLSPGQSSGGTLGSEQAEATTLTTESASFQICAIALDDHPRVNAWAGLAEAGQILAEAERHKGTPLTKAELRAVMEVHLDTYDPDWHFGRAGISDAWMSGWEHAFMLYDQQRARLAHPEPVQGIGLVHAEMPAAPKASQPCTAVQFRRATILVVDPENFWQGIWEGQLAAQTMQGAGQYLWTPWGRAPSPPLSVAWCFDELLDLFAESGNHGLDFVTGYVLGLCEGLLCGRINPPTQVANLPPETAALSDYPRLVENN